MFSWASLIRVFALLFRRLSPAPIGGNTMKGNDNWAERPGDGVSLLSPGDAAEKSAQRLSRPAQSATALRARVLSRTPSACLTVIVTWPVLLTWRSSTVPDLPACVPATTRQATPFAMSATAPPSEPPPERIDRDRLDALIAEEIDQVGRALEAAIDELSENPEVIMQHERALQSLDIACAILDSLAPVLRSADRGKAVDSIAMHEIRSRLSGRQTLS